MVSWSSHKLTFVVIGINQKQWTTKTDIIATIRAVSKWKNIAEVYGTAENIAKVANMLVELQRLLDSIGVKFPKPKTKAEKRMSYPSFVMTLN